MREFLEQRKYTIIVMPTCGRWIIIESCGFCVTDNSRILNPVGDNLGKIQRKFYVLFFCWYLWENENFCCDWSFKRSKTVAFQFAILILLKKFHVLNNNLLFYLIRDDSV